MTDQLQLDLFPSPDGPHPDTTDSVRPETLVKPDDAHRAAIRRMSHVATLDTELSPYEELGGGIATAMAELNGGDRYERFIDAEPWKRDIRTAFDQFNLSALNLGSIRAMSDADQTVLAMHFVRHIKKAEHFGGWVATPGAEGSDLLAGYPFEDEGQIIAYGEELVEFSRVVQASPVYDLLSHRVDSLAQRKRLPASRVRADFFKHDSKLGTPTVVFDSEAQRLRIDRSA